MGKRNEKNGSNANGIQSSDLLKGPTYILSTKIFPESIREQREIYKNIQQLCDQLQTSLKILLSKKAELSDPAEECVGLLVSTIQQSIKENSVALVVSDDIEEISTGIQKIQYLRDQWKDILPDLMNINQRMSRCIESVLHTEQKLIAARRNLEREQAALNRLRPKSGVAQHIDGADQVEEVFSSPRTKSDTSKKKELHEKRLNKNEEKLGVIQSRQTAFETNDLSEHPIFTEDHSAGTPSLANQIGEIQSKVESIDLQDAPIRILQEKFAELVRQCAEANVLADKAREHQDRSERLRSAMQHIDEDCEILLPHYLKALKNVQSDYEKSIEAHSPMTNQEYSDLVDVQYKVTKENLQSFRKSTGHIRLAGELFNKNVTDSFAFIDEKIEELVKQLHDADEKYAKHLSLVDTLEKRCNEQTKIYYNSPYKAPAHDGYPIGPYKELGRAIRQQFSQEVERERMRLTLSSLRLIKRKLILSHLLRFSVYFFNREKDVTKESSSTS